MRWPWSSSSPRENHDDDEKKALPKAHRPVDWTHSLNSIDWSQFTQPSVFIAYAAVFGAFWGLNRVYKNRLRRIPNTEHIKPGQFRSRSVYPVRDARWREKREASPCAIKKSPGRGRGEQDKKNEKK